MYFFFDKTQIWNLIGFLTQVHNYGPLIEAIDNMVQNFDRFGVFIDKIPGLCTYRKRPHTP